MKISFFISLISIFIVSDVYASNTYYKAKREVAKEVERVSRDARKVATGHAGSISSKSKRDLAEMAIKSFADRNATEIKVPINKNTSVGVRRDKRDGTTTVGIRTDF
jgi:hypothetical protein